MRFELFGYTIDINKKLLKNENKDIPEDLQQALETIKKYGLKAKSTEKQKEAVKKATKIRQQRAKQKILNAIHTLKKEGKPINQYQITKKSGCSVNTVRKYIQENKEFIEQIKEDKTLF